MIRRNLYNIGYNVHKKLIGSEKYTSYLRKLIIIIKNNK